MPFQRVTDDTTHINYSLHNMGSDEEYCDEFKDLDEFFKKTGGHPISPSASSGCRPRLTRPITSSGSWRKMAIERGVW